MANSDECCCGCNQVDQDKSQTFCPLCKDEGLSVSKVTIEHLVRDEYLPLIENQRYKVCMNSACDIVYFSPGNGICFTREQVKVPIWFKDGANPRYACYCSEITEEQVLDAVVKLGAESIKDIIAETGAMKNSNCLERNPLGVCCHKIIEEAIAKGKSMR